MAVQITVFSAIRSFKGPDGQYLSNFRALIQVHVLPFTGDAEDVEKLISKLRALVL
jgi:hypothetical protein